MAFTSARVLWGVPDSEESARADTVETMQKITERTRIDFIIFVYDLSLRVDFNSLDSRINVFGQNE